MDREKSRLSENGQLYVSRRAATEYAEDAARHGIELWEEEARRDLTELMMDASLLDGETLDGDLGARCRVRKRSEDIDISARVIRDGRLLVVASVSVRTHPPPRRRAWRQSPR